jgi:hypothetical protein
MKCFSTKVSIRNAQKTIVFVCMAKELSIRLHLSLTSYKFIQVNGKTACLTEKVF